MPKYIASHPAKDTPPSRDRLPKDKTLDADILTQIGPVDADAVVKQSPVGAFGVRTTT